MKAPAPAPVPEEAIAAYIATIDFNKDGEPRQSNRVLALEVADALGVEGAQRLYHFAVLVTKLA